MKTLDGKATYKALLKKGFSVASNKSPDHKWVEFWHEGKLTRVKTKVSHSGEDINDFLIGQMSKQVYLTKKQFISFAECQINKEEYIQLLKNQNLL